MKTLNIVMTLIRQGDHFVLQRREIKPGAGAGGLVGCFGGKIEAGESPAAAAARELREETNLDVASSELKAMVTLQIMSDYRGKPTKVNSEVFTLELPPAFKISAKEGKVVKYDSAEAAAKISTMTPATRAAFSKYILREEKDGS